MTLLPVVTCLYRSREANHYRFISKLVLLRGSPVRHSESVSLRIERCTADWLYEVLFHISRQLDESCPILPQNDRIICIFYK